MDLCGARTLRLSSPNPKTLYLVRHAQGFHNTESPSSHDCFDPSLTPKGFQQASEQRKQIIDSGLIKTIELVITSPLRRTMQTSLEIFRGHRDVNQSDDFPKANNLPPIVAVEICRERLGKYPCDQRESISNYRDCFSAIDFTMIESDEDILGQAEEREELEDVGVRGLHFLKWLWERPEKEIAIVSHGIFLQQTLIALHEKVGKPLEDSLLTRFGNCELRSIQIEKSDMEADTFTSCNCRKCVTTPPSTSLHTVETVSAKL